MVVVCTLALRREAGIIGVTGEPGQGTVRACPPPVSQLTGGEGARGEMDPRRLRGSAATDGVVGGEVQSDRSAAPAQTPGLVAPSSMAGRSALRRQIPMQPRWRVRGGGAGPPFGRGAPPPRGGAVGCAG